MLHSKAIAAPFANGTVYQAYLAALTYHRWHAPVSGTVHHIELVAGTFYSQNMYRGFKNPLGPDPVAPLASQAYLAEVATRGIITIQADNPKIGLMAMVFIGMGEVSSCDFFVWEGERVEQGQQIGTFHYGGSSHCLVFRPETELVWEDAGPYMDEDVNRRVKSLLAVAL